MKKIILVLFLGIGITLGFTNYPIDGYEYTCIKRIYQIQKIKERGEKYTRIPKGAYKKWSEIELNLKDKASTDVNDILKVDAELDAKIQKIIPAGNYSIAVLDISNPNDLRYASHRETTGFQPGSVAKLAVLVAVFDQLSKIYPNDYKKRVDILKFKIVKSSFWGLGDHHTIPIYNIEKDKLTRRQVIASDEFSLFEWLDHMLSVSNNGAASIMFREAMLMAAFGKEYEKLTEEKAENYFKETRRDSLTNLANRVVNEPLRKIGISDKEFKLGGMFTNAAERYVGRKGGSIGTPQGLMKLLLQIEQGKVVDTESSLEMKRLMYMTDRRIRYAKSPRLTDAAVYFKSGSLYKCDRTKNPDCAKYAGNVYNYMNSVIIVEHDNGIKYIVCLMTNVLNKNSAGNHMYLASKIDDIINATANVNKPEVKEVKYVDEKEDAGGN